MSISEPANNRPTLAALTIYVCFLATMSSSLASDQQMDSYLSDMEEIEAHINQEAVENEVGKLQGFTHNHLSQDSVAPTADAGSINKAQDDRIFTIKAIIASGIVILIAAP